MVNLGSQTLLERLADTQAMAVLGNLRLKSDHIAHELAFVALVVAHPSSPIDQFNAFHPLIYSQFDLASEIVQVACQASHDFAHSWRCIWAHSIDYMVGEVGIEA